MDMYSGPKRVLIVDDSPVTCRLLEQRLSADSQLTIAGIAHTGQEAVQMTARLKPDVITMDLVMPGMDGLEATKQIMAYTPTPILILASSINEEGQDLAFEALSYGALDVMEKKDIQTMDLAAHIKAMAIVRVISHPLAKLERLQKQHSSEKRSPSNQDTLIAIVASTGGPASAFERPQRLAF